MKVGVIANREEVARRRAPGVAPGSRAGRYRRPGVARGAEEPQGAQGDAPPARREDRARLRLGRRRHAPALHRRRRRLRRRPRHRPGRNVESARNEPRRARRHRASGRNRARGRAAPPRRRSLQRRALRGHGRERYGRGDDPQRRRRPQRTSRPCRLRMVGPEGRALQVFRRRDRGRRSRLVPGRGDVGSDRQRRRADRPRRGLRGVAAGRRVARGRRRHCRGVHRLDADGRTDRDRRRGGIAVRASNQGSLGQGQARS